MADTTPVQPWQRDYQSAQRRRQLAQHLMQGALAPTQGGMVGRYYVGEGLGGGMTRIGQALLARNYNQSADQSEADALAARQKMNTDAMNTFMGAVTPQEVERTVPTGLDGNLVEATSVRSVKKPSPQQMAAALMQYQNTTGQQVPDTLVKMLNPEPLKVGQGETLFSPTDNSVIFNNPKVPDGMFSDGKGGVSWFPSYLEGKERLAKAGRSQTNINIDNKEFKSAFDKESGKSDAEFLESLRSGARAAQQAIGTLSQLETMSEKVFSGAGANTKLALERWFGAIGVPMSQEAISSENFKSIAGDLVLKQIKMLGANPTNTDLEFINKLVPRLESSPEARLQLITYLKKKAEGAIQDYQGATNYVRKNGNLSGYVGAGVAPGGDPSSLDANQFFTGGR